ncbi:MULTISPECIES: hypothetical protein [unclassified Rhizobium]|uniref:hypothetical protein n=1 Tax=unclassified Rhizobium TaxID=2613769 RepID=UPI000AB587EC|nr:MULTISPECIES: hypothetical protein [unclassified Rhizobium]
MNVALRHFHLEYDAMQHYVYLIAAIHPPPGKLRSISGYLLPTVDHFLKACRTSSRGRLFSFADCPTGTTCGILRL